MSDENEETTLNVKGLDQLMRALKQEPPKTRVGILGSNSSRNSKSANSPNNAEVGAFHEFGTTQLPQRSFLRVPISEKLDKALEYSDAFSEDALKEVLAASSLVPYMKKVALIAEGIVVGAFASGGYGKWQPSNMKYKTNHQTLVETTQLRDSITSEVTS